MQFQSNDDDDLQYRIFDAPFDFLGNKANETVGRRRK